MNQTATKYFPLKTIESVNYIISTCWV
uniref:Uncharacterized protein n=1 Tax=Arundo donax TaxID=35708 RepID=A0A0A9BVV3_ARUDO